MAKRMWQMGDLHPDLRKKLVQDLSLQSQSLPAECMPQVTPDKILVVVNSIKDDKTDVVKFLKETIFNHQGFRMISAELFVELVAAIGIPYRPELFAEPYDLGNWVSSTDPRERMDSLASWLGGWDTLWDHELVEAFGSIVTSTEDPNAEVSQFMRAVQVYVPAYGRVTIKVNAPPTASGYDFSTRYDQDLHGHTLRSVTSDETPAQGDQDERLVRWAQREAKRRVIKAGFAEIAPLRFGQYLALDGLQGHPYWRFRNLDEKNISWV